MDGAESVEISLDDAQVTAYPSPLRRSSFRAGTGSDASAVLARKDSDIKRLSEEKSTLEDRLATAERIAAELKAEEALSARKLARAVELAERSFTAERRNLQRQAQRADLIEVELQESNSRRGIELEGLITLHHLVDDASSRAQLIEEVQAAVKPLRSKVTALNFQLRVSKAIEFKTQQRKIAEAKARLFELETSSNGAQRDLEVRCQELEAEIVALRNAAPATPPAAPHVVDVATPVEADPPVVEAPPPPPAPIISETELQQLRQDLDDTAQANAQLHVELDAIKRQAGRRETEFQSELEALRQEIEDAERRGRTSGTSDATREAAAREATLATSLATESTEKELLQDALAALRGALAKLVAPVKASARAMDGTEDGDSVNNKEAAAYEYGIEFVKHVLVARLAEAAAAVTDADAAEEAESFVTALFEVADIPRHVARLRQLEVQSERDAAELKELHRSQTAITAAEVLKLEQQLSRLAEAHDRLAEEAAERLQLANAMMERVDELRADAAAAAVVRDAEAMEHRALIAQNEEEIVRLVAALDAAHRRTSTVEGELAQVKDLLEQRENVIRRSEAALNRSQTESTSRFEEESSKWRARTVELTARVEQQGHTITESGATIANLRNEMANSKRSAEAFSEEQRKAIVRLEDELKTTTAKLESTLSDLGRSRDTASVLQRKLEQAEEAHKRSEAECHAAHLDIAALRVSSQESTTKLDAALMKANADYVAAAEQIAARGGEVSVLVTKCADLQRQLGDVRDELSRERSSHQAAVDALEQLQAQQRERYQTELAALSSNAQRLEMHCSEKVSSIESAADERVRSVSEDFAAAKEKIAALESELLEMTVSYQNQLVESDTLRCRVMQLEEGARTTQQLHENRITEFNDAIAAGRLETAKLSEALVVAQADARDRRLEADSAKTTAADHMLGLKRAHQRDIAVLDEKLTASENRVKLLEAMVKRKDDEMHSLSQAVATAEERITEIQSAAVARDRLRQDVDALLRQCNAAQDKIEAVSSEKTAAQMALRDALAQIADLTNQLHAAKLHTDELNRQREAMKQNMDLRDARIEQLINSLRSQTELTRQAEDAARKQETLHAMTAAELTTTKAEHEATLQSLRDAEQLNVDLLVRVTEVENSLDDSRIQMQREKATRSIEKWSHTAGFNVSNAVSGAMSPIMHASPTRANSGGFAGSARDAVQGVMSAVEQVEFEIRRGLNEHANDYFVFVRRLRSMLDDAAHVERIGRQKLQAEQRRVSALTDHVASLQAETTAIREAWHTASHASLAEATMMVVMEEAQARRIAEVSFLLTLSTIVRDALVWPLVGESQRVVNANRNVALERKAADSAVGRAAFAEERLHETEASVNRLRHMLTESEGNVRTLREAQELLIRERAESTRQGTMHRLTSVEADEAYCRWIIFDAGFTNQAVLHSACVATAQSANARVASRRGLGVEQSTQLVREISMWRSRCHAIVELEKASLDAAIDTAVRGRRDNLAPPRPASLVTLQTLEQMQRRLLQQSFFDTQLLLSQCAGWC